jgi:hypothetical protein
MASRAAATTDVRTAGMDRTPGRWARDHLHGMDDREVASADSGKGSRDRERRAADDRPGPVLGSRAAAGDAPSILREIPGAWRGNP